LRPPETEVGALFSNVSPAEPEEIPSGADPDAAPLDGGASSGFEPAPPPAPSNWLEVARTEDTVILRSVGLANMKLAMGMMDFTAEMLRAGYRQFVFDLADCKGLDSTFMGAMVGLAAASEEHGGAATVVNAGTSNLELLQIVGADKFLRLKGDYEMEDIETERLEATSPSPERRLELVKRAHENLVDIDKRNAARFGAFLRQLSSELAK